jgi:hypothetical protein
MRARLQGNERPPSAPTRAGLSTIVAVLFVLLVVGGSTADAQRRYTLSQDADDEILSIGWVSSMNPTRRFSLYGDGRLVGRIKGFLETDPDAEDPVELWLSREEVTAIADIVVGAGLVEFEPGDQYKRLGFPLTTDTDALWLRISLKSYEGPRRKEVRSFVHSTGVDSPEDEIERYHKAKKAGRIAESEPDTFVEAEALLRLYEDLDQLVYGKQDDG